MKVTKTIYLKLTNIKSENMANWKIIKMNDESKSTDFADVFGLRSLAIGCWTFQ